MAESSIKWRLPIQVRPARSAGTAKQRIVRHTDNADHVAALNILARGLNRVSACGESGGNARTQVNSGRLFETGSGQQQEPIEEITGLVL